MRTVLSLCNSRSQAAQLCSAYRAVAHHVVGGGQHRPLGGTKPVVSLPIPDTEQIVGRHAQSRGDAPVLRPLIVAPVSQPIRMITNSRNRESSAPCHNMVASRSLNGRASSGGSAAPERCRARPYSRHDRPRRRRLWPRRAADRARGLYCHGVSTPCTGGTPSRSPAMVASKSSASSSPTQRRGRLSNG